METKVLNLIVSKPKAFAGVDFSEYREELNKAISEGHTPVIIQYFHGILESKLGYDIGLCLNGEDCTNIENENYKEGIYDAVVDGYESPCKAFLWNSRGYPRGLIVDSLDLAGLNYAQKKYSEKEFNL